MEIVRRWQEDGIPEKLYPLPDKPCGPGIRYRCYVGLKSRTGTLRANWLRDDDARLPALCLTGVKGCEESNISESNLYK